MRAYCRDCDEPASVHCERVDLCPFCCGERVGGPCRYCALDLAEYEAAEAVDRAIDYAKLDGAA